MNLNFFNFQFKKTLNIELIFKILILLTLILILFILFIFYYYQIDNNKEFNSLFETINNIFQYQLENNELLIKTLNEIKKEKTILEIPTISFKKKDDSFNEMLIAIIILLMLMIGTPFYIIFTLRSDLLHLNFNGSMLSQYLTEEQRQIFSGEFFLRLFGSLFSQPPRERNDIIDRRIQFNNQNPTVSVNSETHINRDFIVPNGTIGPDRIVNGRTSQVLNTQVDPTFEGSELDD